MMVNFLFGRMELVQILKKYYRIVYRVDERFIRILRIQYSMLLDFTLMTSFLLPAYPKKI